ncbi:DUF4123 domain-containing protein [Marinobacter fonticola]|uniref:DUF4123 domain-containing protein n=1 Tax=Marinobacter fonticola TaxID=2603215 RepID=UPI0011E64827|nr:DUF4123 domain-containing protein [Marinobacter fonticola]
MIADKQTHLFLLLDGAKLNAPRITYQHDDAPWADWLYRGTRHETALDVSPYLVKPSADSRLWANQTDWAENGLVLKTNATPEELIGHLRSLISVRLPSGQLSYCRFYSNTRLHQFLYALTEAERSLFSGPITQWQNPSATAAWQSIATEGEAEAKSAEDEGWFQLTEEHIGVLNRTQAEAFLTKLGRHLGLDTSPASSAQLGRLVHHAQEHGFHSEKDVARYTELALRHPQKLNEEVCIAVLKDPQATNSQKLNQLDHLLAYGGAR